MRPCSSPSQIFDSTPLLSTQLPTTMPEHSGSAVCVYVLISALLAGAVPFLRGSRDWFVVLSLLVQWDTFLGLAAVDTPLRWVVPGLQLTGAHDEIGGRADDVDDGQDPEHDLPLAVGLL